MYSADVSHKDSPSIKQEGSQQESGKRAPPMEVSASGPYCIKIIEVNLSQLLEDNAFTLPYC
jgi:hypothetical protein